MELKYTQAELAFIRLSAGGKPFSAVEFAEEAKISRPYANLILATFVSGGRVTKIGIARNTRYVANSLSIHEYKNLGLREEEISEQIIRTDARFKELPDHIRSIVEYAFLEMCNNAIEHSRGEKITITFSVSEVIKFEIIDNGIGVFRNVKNSRHLQSELEAAQDLLKGKTTTAPALHSGEGIFFTSKIADEFKLESYGYILDINNNINDFAFGESGTPMKGTRVEFIVSASTTKHLSETFEVFSSMKDDGIPSFDTTEIVVQLYQNGGTFISRSQARRVLAGLEKFSRIIMDFTNVPMVGQAFVDEVFRVFPQSRPGTLVEYRNANTAVTFMIERAINTVR